MPALERGRTHVIHPRRAALGYAFPRLARADARRLAARAQKETDPEVMEAMLALVVRTGSHGDEAPRAARAAWEAARS